MFKQVEYKLIYIFLKENTHCVNCRRIVKNVFDKFDLIYWSYKKKLFSFRFHVQYGGVWACARFSTGSLSAIISYGFFFNKYNIDW